MPTRTALTAPDHACPRCAGLLVYERLAYAHDNWACANCGNRLDARILANRTASPLPYPDHDYPRRYPLILSSATT